MSRPANDELPWYLNFSNWFILAGIIGACLLWWFAQGQPGLPLKDGDYGCRTPTQGGFSIPGPGATVVNGKVVAAWDFDFATGTTSSVPFSNAERRDPNSFTMISVALGGYQYEFECTYSR